MEGQFCIAQNTLIQIFFKAPVIRTEDTKLVRQLLKGNVTFTRKETWEIVGEDNNSQTVTIKQVWTNCTRCLTKEWLYKLLGLLPIE